MLNPIDDVARFIRFGDQFQILDAPAYGHAQLVGVNDTGKLFAGSLSVCPFVQKIFISRKQNSAEPRAAIQQFRIVQECRAIFLRGQHLHPRRRNPSVIADGTWTSM